MSAEENKALLRRYVEEVWDKRNLDLAQQLGAELSAPKEGPQ